MEVLLALQLHLLVQHVCALWFLMQTICASAAILFLDAVPFGAENLRLSFEEPPALPAFSGPVVLPHRVQGMGQERYAEETEQLLDKVVLPADERDGLVHVLAIAGLRVLGRIPGPEKWLHKGQQGAVDLGSYWHGVSSFLQLLNVVPGGAHLDFLS
jgi:hypothetical protein